MPDRNEPRMEMRALVAVVLSMLVLSLYQYWFVPPVASPPPSSSASAEAAGENATGTEAASEIAGTAPAGTQGPQATARSAGRPIAAEREERIVVESSHYRAEFTNEGARLVHFELLGYGDGNGAPLDLVHPGARRHGALPLGLWSAESGAAAANAALWRAEGAAAAGTPLRVGPDEQVELVFRWSDGRDWDVTKRIRLTDDFLLEAEIAGLVPAGTHLRLGPGLDAAHGGSRRRFLTRGGIALRDGDLVRWKAAALEAPEQLGPPLSWFGVESEYFLAAFLVDGAAGSAVVGAADVGPAVAGGEPEREVWAAWAAQRGGGVTIYLGPKRYDGLVAVGHELARAVDFGFWGFLSRPLLLLLNWIYGYAGNYGVAIVLLTLLLRLVFWPLNQRAMVSMRKMQRLQPQMAAIRAKYQGAKDLEKRQRMQEEIMELYRREGVSPFGGCLPMLAQFPILLAFYSMLSVAIELRGAPFVLWIRDLSQHDPYLVLPLLMGASMIVQQRMTPTAGANATQASMMRLMPVVFTVLFLWVPSGLVLYWLVNNVLGIGQQAWINRSMNAQQVTQQPGRKGGRKGQRGKR